MRRASADEPLLDRLVTGKNEVIFNLLYLIRESDAPMLFTDGACFIAAQSSEKTPLWLFLNATPGPEAETELCGLLAERMAENPALSITAQSQFVQGLFARLSAQTGFRFVERMRMNAYACHAVNEQPCAGRMVRPQSAHRERMCQLITQMHEDAVHEPLSREAAERFAERTVSSPALFLWEDGDIAAMAYIPHKTARYARINTVVTDRACRGRGYAKALVGAMCRALLSEGLIPMLYADADYPASNAAYRRIGFEKQGEITDYRLE